MTQPLKYLAGHPAQRSRTVKSLDPAIRRHRFAAASRNSSDPQGKWAGASSTLRTRRLDTRAVRDTFSGVEWRPPAASSPAGGCLVCTQNRLMAGGALGTFASTWPFPQLTKPVIVVPFKIIGKEVFRQLDLVRIRSLSVGELRSKAVREATRRSRSGGTSGQTRP